jgi:hypothetical protein
MIGPGPIASIMMACVDRPRTLPQNIHNHVCIRLYGALTQTTFKIITSVSTSNPIPNIIKNWNVDGKLGLAYDDNVLMCTFQSILSFKAYCGELTWKAIRDRLRKPYYLSRVGHVHLERKKQSVTLGGIVCWQQNVLRWLDKGWEVKGVGELWDICWKI